MRAVWLLDIDGVINTSQKPGWGEAPRQGIAYSQGNGFRMRWAPRLVARILHLRETFDVDLRWSSTWCMSTTHPELLDTHQVEQLMGFPRLPIGSEHLRDVTVRTRHYAKGLTAVEVMQAGHPVIWTDDEAITEFKGFFESNEGRLPPHLFIEPDPRRGLQPHHLDDVEAFLQEHSAT